MIIIENTEKSLGFDTIKAMEYYDSLNNNILFSSEFTKNGLYTNLWKTQKI